MESLGFSCIELSWLSEIFRYFTDLRGEPGQTAFNMGTLLFAVFSL